MLPTVAKVYFLMVFEFSEAEKIPISSFDTCSSNSSLSCFRISYNKQIIRVGRLSLLMASAITKDFPDPVGRETMEPPGNFDITASTIFFEASS